VLGVLGVLGVPCGADCASFHVEWREAPVGTGGITKLSGGGVQGVLVLCSGDFGVLVPLYEAHPHFRVIRVKLRQPRQCTVAHPTDSAQ